MYKLYVLLIALLLVGCVSSSDFLTPEQEAIPNYVDTIILKSDLSSDNLYQEILNKLKIEGIRIETADKEIQSINTDAIDVGQYTKARYTFSIIEENDKAAAIITGQYKIASGMSYGLTGQTDMGWEKAYFDDGRPKRVLAYAMNLFSDYEQEYK